MNYKGCRIEGERGSWRVIGFGVNRGPFRTRDAAKAWIAWMDFLLPNAQKQRKGTEDE